MCCIFLAFGLAFYLGRNKIKEIDRLVYGFEIPSDSIFYQGFRLMGYGGAFAWYFSAKRSKLLYIREKFDEKFQRPFKLYYWLMLGGALLMVFTILLDKFYLHFTS